MAKEKIKKGLELHCVWCGREVIVSNSGISASTLLCCGRPMEKKRPSSVKRAKVELPKDV